MAEEVEAEEVESGDVEAGEVEAYSQKALVVSPSQHGIKTPPDN